MKDHKSHDVVLMCTPCHRHSTTLDMILKSHFGERFDAPIGTMSGMKYKQDFSIQKVKSAAKYVSTTIKIIKILLNDYY